MFVGVAPPTTNPPIDYHIIYIFLLPAIYFAHAEGLPASVMRRYPTM
jgi:hypothetical protein